MTDLIPTEQTKQLLTNDYQMINQSLSLLFHTAKAYSVYQDAEKRAIADYKQAIRTITNVYLDAINQQVDLDNEAKFSSLRRIKLNSLEKDCKEVIQKGLELSEASRVLMEQKMSSLITEIDLKVGSN